MARISVNAKVIYLVLVVERVSNEVTSEGFFSRESDAQRWGNLWSDVLYSVRMRRFARSGWARPLKRRS